MSPSRFIRVAVLAACAVIAALSTACGYALAGRSNSLPSTIKVIGIPDCQNQSGTPDVDRALTDAVRTEFSSRGKFTVLPQATGVDAVLTCTIVNVQLVPTNVNAQTHQADTYSITVTANIAFHDLNDANKTRWANPAMQSSEPYTVTNAQLANDTSSLLRNDADAMTRLGRKFAKDVVTAILEGF